MAGGMASGVISGINVAKASETSAGSAGNGEMALWHQRLA
jgi:hypothetical protein